MATLAVSLPPMVTGQITDQYRALSVAVGRFCGQSGLMHSISNTMRKSTNAADNSECQVIWHTESKCSTRSRWTTWESCDACLCPTSLLGLPRIVAWIMCKYQSLWANIHETWHYIPLRLSPISITVPAHSCRISNNEVSNIWPHTAQQNNMLLATIHCNIMNNDPNLMILHIILLMKF